MYDRFTIGDYNNDFCEIYDDGEFLTSVKVDDGLKICKMLNDLSCLFEKQSKTIFVQEKKIKTLEEENSELKKENQRLDGVIKKVFWMEE